ncbi:tetratricopeptide repeat protein [Rhodoligotrophos defluvii]|uniref:tetratricopeptide repeat protein n=1 Tax=Rhodoligotrophos defluvii TaxID=2561934 RepID=UPI0014853F81|nr:tetratricopeptide repeat protein [Rhodoligotrophos defluvii]
MTAWLASLLFSGVASATGSSVWASDVNDIAAHFYSFIPASPKLTTKSLVPPTWADERERASEAYQKGDFATALVNLKQASDDGDLIATLYLGHMYRLGQGVTADNKAALQYYERVAAAFNPDESDPKLRWASIDALVQVANYYRVGDKQAGIAPDPERALNIYKLASTYSHPAAQYALGLMYFKGEGTRRNREQAVRWLMLAARKRYAPAEALLGDMYWDGDYVRQDRIRALMWYILAQQSARPEENPEIFDRYEHLMKEASAAERTDAEGRAQDWAAKFPRPMRSVSP